jgi:hypothetical protein
MVRRLRGLAGFALGSLLSLSGCAESIYLRSYPPGANVTINGEPVGRTPLTYSVVPASWKPPYRFRAERPGYVPVEGTLATEVSEGRVVGGIFSLGLSLFFKQPETFVDDEYVFDLRPETAGSSRSRATRREPRPEPRPPALPYDPPSGPEDDRYDRTPPQQPPAAPRLRPPPPLPTARPSPGPTRIPRPSPTAVPLPPADALDPPVPVPAPAAPELPPPAEPPPDVQAELERLRKLRDEGVIVDAEYEQLRESVLKGQ